MNEEKRIQEIRSIIQVKIDSLEKEYDYYLEKTEDILYMRQWKYYEERLHDLRIEINILKETKNLMED